MNGGRREEGECDGQVGEQGVRNETPHWKSMGGKITGSIPALDLIF